MTTQNKLMKMYLKKAGIDCNPMYIKEGSMKGTWRFYGKGKWWGNKELQQKFIDLGFVNFMGEPINDHCGNGGDFSVFLMHRGNYQKV